MNQKPVQKLIGLARKAHQPAPAPQAESAPWGFATRVVARLAEPNGATRASFWERWCWWGAGASVAVCLIASAQHALQPEPNAFDLALEAQAEETEIP
jgi:hypothetical protein